jgi:hypothetical protein
MERGAFAGYPMSNVKVIVYDGKEHEVDSKPMAFEIAGREAFKLAVHEAGPVLFEPIMNVRVTCPGCEHGRCDERPQHPPRTCARHRLGTRQHGHCGACADG